MKKNYTFTFKTLSIKVTSIKKVFGTLAIRSRAIDTSNNENGLFTVYIEEGETDEETIKNFENEVKDFFNDYFKN